ncbi:MAG: GNAT family N-acetyltransferase [Proteobacteria bacterium]|nr:GNAT family N-acetyltransferase [Pseudomonadota bacterium]
MFSDEGIKYLNEFKRKYPEKFADLKLIFKQIQPGCHIFIGTACGEPVFLVKSLIDYVKENPKAFFDAELLQVVTLGVAPYADLKFKDNFRHNAFFIGQSSRESVNKGLSDYTPIFLSQVPDLINRRLMPIDVAIIQVSMPDKHGFVSLGISVDIVKSAVENSKIVIAQVNSFMPRVHGETFINIRDIDFLVHYDEPLLEYDLKAPDDIAEKIGGYVSRIIKDGDTLQVGYGSIPNAILAHLKDKNDLGIHTELLTEGVVNLMKLGVVNNSKKDLNRGKTVASFCMANREVYEYLHDNPSFEFRPINYTNNPLNIARNRNMVAINSALEIDLTGQATAESIGKVFYSGVGGQADFMRGAVLSPGGRTILAIQSTAKNGTVSRIVPFLKEGAGVTLIRGDIHYVVTEYGIAYLHGKNIRERAMELIAIAHPKFRPWLIEQAKSSSIIYKDQAFFSGESGDYPSHLETYRTTKTGLKIFIRPVKISDEHLLKDFFYSLSDDTIYSRFVNMRREMHHEDLQRYCVVDYTKELVLLALTEEHAHAKVLGIAQYYINDKTHMAEVAFVVRDDMQNQGIGWELLSYITYLARKKGLLGFTAQVLVSNKPMLHLFEKKGFVIEKRRESEIYELKMTFE